MTSMECLADVDITFNYKSPHFTKEKRLAECEQEKCFLVNHALADRYSVEKTRQGGRLVILKDDIGTHGQYRCCESYNISACDSMEIGPPTTSILTTVNVHQHSEEDTSARKGI
ncbi:hypothetical protein DPMN_024011 [Dreissena polymorpha]|uniref:Uncharacterized protein n=1 Tax=Dreissena polymorpha TaxID=45954 RepID=A0A9D4LM72_DREPO|nr:hypothetical protein DPMN_024011 [Dreissena polymorpha]